MHFPMRSFSIVVAAALACACGSTATRRVVVEEPVVTDPNLGVTVGALTVEPANGVYYIDTSTTPPTASKQGFRVIWKSADGDVDVTDEATFALADARVGGFAGADFTTATTLPTGLRALSSVVSVSARELAGVAAVTVVPLKRTSEDRDFFFLEPFQEAPSPASDVLRFETKIRAADVVFAVDNTGSMSGTIRDVQTELAGTLMPRLRAAIPSVGLSVVSFQDEVDGAGVVEVYQRITTVLADAQAAAGRMSARGGGDLPEANVAAMWHILTGKALGTLVPAHVPPAGFSGGVNFRKGAVPVVVQISDADWQDPSMGVTAVQLATAFKTANARFVSVTTTTSFGASNEAQADTLSDATSSNVLPSVFSGCGAGKCCTGVNGAAREPVGASRRCRLNFKYTPGSATLANSVVSAIKAISGGSIYDVTAAAVNDPANPGGVDATKFIRAMRAKDEGDAAQGCAARQAKDTNGDGVNDTFVGVTIGAKVCFEVIPETNAFVTPTEAAQFFTAKIEVRGVPGAIVLDTRDVLLLVPPQTPVVN